MLSAKNQKYVLLIILASIVAVFLISRLIAYLVIDLHFLPHGLFVSVGTYRLHHFVYGNILILITSFLAIGLNAKINKNWLALFYGVGLGLVLDEFPLWMGNVSQLKSEVVWIPYGWTAVLTSALIVALLIALRKK